VGGGIFSSATDMGAAIVEELGFGIGEDDASNPVGG
jgi:Na+/H+-translocating membrane pyrophosphatase